SMGTEVVAAGTDVWVDSRGHIIAADSVAGANGPRPDLVDDGSGNPAGEGTWYSAVPRRNGTVRITELAPGDSRSPDSSGFDPTGRVLRLGAEPPPDGATRLADVATALEANRAAAQRAADAAEQARRLLNQPLPESSAEVRAARESAKQEG